jgi:ABC-2 type transport system permease protein
MAKLWVVIKREYLERVQNKWFVISTVLAPLFFSAMIFLPALLTLRSMRSAEVSNIIILDATGAGMGARVDSAIRAARPRPQAEAGGAPAADATMQVRVVAPGEIAQAESLASREVRTGPARGYLVLDAGSLAGDSARYVGSNASSRAVVDRISRAARDVSLALRLERAGIDPGRVRELTGKRLALNAERLTATGRGRTGMGNVMFGLAVTVLLYISIILYGQNVMRGVMEEKQTRVAEVVVSSVKPDTLLAGKILGVGAVGLTQQILWFALTAGIGAYIAPFFAKSARAAAQDMVAQGGGAARDMNALMGGMPSITLGQIALLFAFFLIGYFLYSALFAAVGAMVNDEREAQQALGPVMVLLIGSSFLMQPVMFNPSSDLARWSSLIPFSAPIIMPLRMTMVQVPPLEIAISIVGGILMVALFSWLAARIYRVGLLMYGKKPNMAELARWVRQAA